ncbi:hypothetical protein [Lacisediminimonas sp.]|uniref:hypothetical protein n=1 Tax=Lacisediminimonas sp. TaxID=3060582 RepID=UPI002720BA56|nr:hypothetical protein [Lacisediminimonas sp.]MDO8301140.1 hypothetical protein [Lacisediminimonas sp.]
MLDDDPLVAPLDPDVPGLVLIEPDEGLDEELDDGSVDGLDDGTVDEPDEAPPIVPEPD